MEDVGGVIHVRGFDVDSVESAITNFLGARGFVTVCADYLDRIPEIEKDRFRRSASEEVIVGHYLEAMYLRSFAVVPAAPPWVAVLERGEHAEAELAEELSRRCDDFVIGAWWDGECKAESIEIYERGRLLGLFCDPGEMPGGLRLPATSTGVLKSFDRVLGARGYLASLGFGATASANFADALALNEALAELRPRIRYLNFRRAKASERRR